MGNFTLRCYHCGNVFESDMKIQLLPGMGMHLNKGTMERCPRCQEMVEFEGTLTSTLGGMVAAIRQSADPLQAARTLLAELEAVQAGHGSGAIAPKSNLPSIQVLLPDKKWKVGAYVLVLRALIELLKEGSPLVEVNVTQIINRAVAESPALDQQPAPVIFHESPPISRTPPGRNTLCPCGSGEKFKHCCGRPGGQRL